MTPSDPALIVIAKEPLPGRVKTRLTPPLAAEEAAALAEAALADTLDAVARAAASERVLALDGAPGPWLPDGFEVIEQARGGLADRLAAAFAYVAGPALLVGMDTPQLTAAAIDRSSAALMDAGVDAVLGPADDGGYWAIGLRRAVPGAFTGVPMSSADTCARQRERLDELGLRVAELEPMQDVDTIDDAREVASLCPSRRFGALFRSLRWAGA